MKKVLTTLLAVIIATSLPLTAYATESSNNVYSFDGITVEFSEDSLLTAEEQSTIAQLIVNGNASESSTTYNLLCTLFGHKTSVETVGVIEHCVRADQPRCLKSIQDITTCSRCDYVSVDVASSYYIVCCD